MSNPRWMIYGANGYTGVLIAEVAKRRGLTPIVAGRRADAIRPIAERHGFEMRVFSLDDPAALARELDGVDALLLAAGPFSATSKPAVDACLRSKTHYLDITGEIAVFEACAARGDDAKRAGVALLPGAGFDVVPSDCLAASLKAALPSATSLELAFAGEGTWSKGTAKTMAEGLGYGGASRRNGRIVRERAAQHARRVPFRDRERTCLSIPWGDVSTAYHSTGIGNIVVYTHLGRRMRQLVQVGRPLLPVLRWKPLQNFLKQQIDQRIKGPSASVRESAKTQLWGRVTDEAGHAVEGTLVTPEGYALTSETAVESTLRLCAAGKTGFLTPSLAFGAGYIAEFDGCDLQVGDTTDEERRTA